MTDYENAQQHLERVAHIMGQFALSRGRKAFIVPPRYDLACVIQWGKAESEGSSMCVLNLTMMSSDTVSLYLKREFFPQRQIVFSHTCPPLRYDDERLLTAYLEKGYEALLAIEAATPLPDTIAALLELEREGRLKIEHP